MSAKSTFLVIDMKSICKHLSGHRYFAHQSLLVPVVPEDIEDPVVTVNTLKSVNNIIPADIFGTSDFFFVKHPLLDTKISWSVHSIIVV